MDYEEMRTLLAESLKPSRYQHSLGVAETAVFLAQRFAVDEEQAQVAVIAVKQLLSSTLDRLSLVAFQLHIHIRLSCTDPYLTDHHVAQLNVVLVLEADEVGTSCLRGLYL